MEEQHQKSLAELRERAEKEAERSAALAEERDAAAEKVTEGEWQRAEE